MGKLKLGLIGAGGIVRGAHYRAISKLTEDIKVVAVADVVRTAAEAIVREFNAEYVFEDYNELLNLKEVDAVLITVPNYLHARAAIDALEAGKHVLCEKPMAINGFDAERMVEVQKKTGRTLMVALNNRFRRDVQHLKILIESGELGDIYYAKSGWMRRAGIPGWGGWFTNQSKSGGGPLIDIGIHMLDLALYIMGNPKPVSVVGSTYKKFGHMEQGKSRVWKVADPQGIYNVEDLATAFIRLDNGATLTLDVSWAANIEKDSVFVNLMGTKGGAAIENSKGVAIYTERYGEQYDIYPQIKFNDDEARFEMWKHFIYCVKTGTAPIGSPVQAMFVNKILDAIYESSKTGREVYIATTALE